MSELSQPDAAPEQQRFSWTRSWYPIANAADLDKRKPHEMHLLGMPMVIWHDGTNWNCLKDRCPHRLAPLSEGRIEKGELMCSYHGWTFDSSGACTRVPQINDPKAQATTCASPRSCVESYPTKEFGGLLYVWPEPGPEGAARAAASPEPANALEQVLGPSGPGNAWAMRTPWFVRDLAIRCDTLLENALDPSHVPFAHHGVQGNRNRVPNAKYEVAREPEPSTGFEVAQTAQLGKRTVSVKIRFTPPAAIDYIFSFGGLHARCVPTKQGWTRILACFTKRTDFKAPLPMVIFQMMESITWLEHTTRNSVLDGDTYMLHVAERALLEEGYKWKKSYFLPSNAEVPVLALHKWLDECASEMPTCTKADAARMPPPMTKRQVLDRYSQHTAHCRVCQRAIKVIDALRAAAVAGALACAVAVVSRAVAGLPLLQPANGWALGAAAACCLGLRLLQKMRDKYFYEEYEHAFKH